MRNINYAFLPPGNIGSLKLIKDTDLPVVSDEFTRMCKLVYAINPKTLLPCSDLSVLFSDSVPLDIAEWVRRNLQRPIDSVPSSIINGQQVDDDTLIALTRNVGESDRDYIKRCDGILSSMFKTGEGV